MRIVSLVPHATELLFALGLGEEVVGVTHECDFPAQAATLPHVTRDQLPAGLSAAGIDEAVRERAERGESISGLDEDLLAELRPDLILTQELCTVCAVGAGEVRAIAKRLPGKPRVLSLNPGTFGETMAEVRTVALAAGREEAGVDLVARQRARVDAVVKALEGVTLRTVAAIEWLDPVYVAGHWTPQLIEMAGGIDVLGFAGERSERTEWEAVAAAEPDVLLCIPCGYDAPRALEEAGQFRAQVESVGAREVIALDASAYFSRPGPRLVDGLETLAHALHPDRVPAAPGSVLRLT